MTTVPEKFERLKDKFIPSALRSRKQSHAKTTSEGRSDVAIPSSQIHTEETVAHTPLYAQRDPLTDGSTALVPTHMGMQSSELRSSGVHPVTQGALDVEPSTMDTAPLSGHPFESVEDRTMQQPNDTSHWNITSPVKSNGEQDHVPRKVTEIPSAQVFISEIESVAGASSRAEKWKDACGNFEVEHPKSYEKLTACLRVFQEHGTSKEPDVSKLPHSRQLVSKLRRYLPIHAAIRSTVMPIAALDPQKIAPICCAALFTLVELCLGIPNPEAYNKTLEAFLEAVSTIQEWTSFETKYVPRVESSNSNIAEINAGLPDLYVKCLLLIADIQHSFHRGPVPSKC
ncbi:hypothetical protein DE146DRAFT_188681 [Phaeosphaeria sp. MPI-PUGE-AT-0046c]|nr:hypothetical protein DE146DRAFT_188681 [Phaeosphaeria sp. MPI-PUGE-AT-0046c]